MGEEIIIFQNSIMTAGKDTMEANNGWVNRWFLEREATKVAVIISLRFSTTLNSSYAEDNNVI